MKLVFLDGFAFEEPGLSLAPFDAFGEVKFFSRTPPEQVIQRAQETEILFTNKCVLDRAVLDACPSLRYIGVMATGYNTVDADYAAQKRIAVTNIPNYSTQAVAQHVFALILHFYNQVDLHSRSVHNGDWQRCPDFFYTKAPLFELAGKTIGIVGCGAIGREVAKIARAFSMEVRYSSRTAKPELEDEHTKFVSFEELLKTSDIITLHCPLTPQTQGMMNADAFARMKEGAVLINTSRGPVVEEAALAQALNSGRLLGAGVDVVSQEPMREDNPLLTAKNCVITPHIAWAPLQTRERLLSIAADNLRQFLRGNPVNQVNPW